MLLSWKESSTLSGTTVTVFIGTTLPDPLPNVFRAEFVER
jgi:hypothetical protein